MDILLYGSMAVFFIIFVYLNLLATLVIRHGDILPTAQIKAQLLFVWLIPFVGASLVLYFMFRLAPDVIPRSWIPWPFRTIIYAKPIKANKNREERERRNY